MERLSWVLRMIQNVITSLPLKKKKKAGEDLAPREEDNVMGFPGGPLLKNIPCDAGD